MKKEEMYRTKLAGIANWDAYLKKESGLPGPRGNLELAQAVADAGNAELFLRYISLTPEQAPTNSPDEFLAVCGAIGLGRLVAEGKGEYLSRLRSLASDPRWRIREGVAMALQRVGDRSMPRLLAEMEKWSRGNLLEKRAAAAALCEPRLLREPAHIKRVLLILDNITASISDIQDRKSAELKVLRQGMGYCWSVAIAALPLPGKQMFEKWFSSSDPDVIWILKENLKKARLTRMDPEWVARSKKRIEP